jgi:hypothetical protein
MMKQILLRVPAMFPKIGFGKFAQPPRCHFLSTPQITVPQNALDPDVDWECAKPLVCKEHHAICDLRSYARQSTELFSKAGIGKSRPCSQVRLA